MMFDFLFNDLPRFDQAECAKLEDQDFFFPNSGVELQQRLPILRQLCGKCPHQAECLDYSIDKEIIEGFWGGMTPDQRKRIIRTNQERKDRRSEKFREVQELLDLGFTKELIAARLGIKVSSVERRMERAKQRGIS